MPSRPGDILGPAADSLEAELFANAMINAATIGEALERAQGRLAEPRRIQLPGASTAP